MLDKIKEALDRGRPAVTLAAYVWRRSGDIIAGATHLPRDRQLKFWAEINGFECEYDPDNDWYRFTKVA